MLVRVSFFVLLLSVTLHSHFFVYFEDFAPRKQLDIFSFTSQSEVEKFQITTDRVLGGATVCSFSQKQYKEFCSGAQRTKHAH